MPVFRRHPVRIAAATISLAVVAALAACSTAPAETPSDGPVADGTLRIGLSTAIDCFDPQISPSGVTSAVLRNVYDSLVSENADGTFSPWLASAWEISDDGLTYTFTLRDNVVFHDGTPFDAEAVRVNLDRIVDPTTTSQYAGQLIAPYESTEIIDEHTVAVHLDRPYSPFLRAVASTNLGFHSPASIDEFGDDLCQGGAAQVGTGPFVFTSSTAGQGFEFERNDDYDWAPENAEHEGAAHLASVEYRFLSESAVRLGALTSGEVDLIDQVATTDTATIEAASDLELHAQDPTGIPYSYFLNTSHAPFDDLRARQAFQQGIDFATLTESIFGGAYQPTTSPLNPAVAGYTDVESPAYDPDAAGALLDELGYAETDAEGYRTRAGERLSLELIYDPTYQRPERITYDTAVQAALKEIGVELVITPIGDGTYVDVRNTGAYDVVAFAWSGTDPDLLRTIYGSDQQLADGGGNGSQARDTALDALLQQGVEETDASARADVYAQAQQLIVDEAYGVPAYVAPVLTAHRTIVSGLTYDANTLPRLYDAWTPVR